MARKCLIEKEKHRKKLADKYAARRIALKKIANDKSLEPAERMNARFKLDRLPRNSKISRQRNRCALTGRPRGYYRDLGISRIALRSLASEGELPGIIKSSW